MSKFATMDPAELVGEGLNYAVALIVGKKVRIIGPQCGMKARVFVEGTAGAILRFDPVNDWAHGGPLIDEFKVGFQFELEEYTEPENPWYAECGVFWDIGPTHLVAACRAIVAATCDFVSVPRELLP